MNRRGTSRESTRALAAAGISIALATGLSMIVFFRMPMDGSVTAGSMLPIILFALVFGAGKGVLAGIVYGLLQMIINPLVVHWAQALLDYPVAFGALGLAGLFAADEAVRREQPMILRRLAVTPWPKVILATFVAIFVRFLAHVWSGVVFFGQYASEGQTPLVYSILYNGSYLLPEFAITVVLLVAMRALFARTSGGKPSG